MRADVWSTAGEQEFYQHERSSAGFRQLQGRHGRESHSATKMYTGKLVSRRAADWSFGHVSQPS